jgi:hypothetical protein
VKKIKRLICGNSNFPAEFSICISIVKVRYVLMLNLWLSEKGAIKWNTVKVKN